MRREPTPSRHDAAVSTKNVAKGNAHSVIGKPQRKKPQSMSRNATALAARSHSSFLRATSRPSSRAHVCTAFVMSSLALLSFCPDVAVFFAVNSLPEFISFNRDATARLTGSRPDHWPVWAMLRSVHSLSPSCCSVMSLRSAR